MKSGNSVRRALAVAGVMAVFATQNAFADKAYVSVKVYDGQEDRGYSVSSESLPTVSVELKYGGSGACG